MYKDILFFLKSRICETHIIFLFLFLIQYTTSCWYIFTRFILWENKYYYYISQILKVVFVLPKQELENTFAKFLSKMKVAKIYLTVFSVISCEICTFWTFISDLHSLLNNFSCYWPLLFSCSIFFFFLKGRRKISEIFSSLSLVSIILFWGGLK